MGYCPPRDEARFLRKLARSPEFGGSVTATVARRIKGMGATNVMTLAGPASSLGSRRDSAMSRPRSAAAIQSRVGLIESTPAGPALHPVVNQVGRVFPGGHYQGD